jgi:hypothetical protein
MAYQHLNRLRAHLQENLTPTERLTAWVIATELRLDKDPLKDGAFSVSQRRLEIETGASKPTLSRAIARLISLGIFSASKSGVSTWAKTYRLEIACPDDCQNLKNHNTETELAFIAAMRHAESENAELVKFEHQFISTRGNFDNPYKELSKEKKKTDLAPEVSLSDLYLGFIAQALETVEKPSSDHETLKGAIGLRPDEVAQAALEILERNKPGSPRTYLAKIARQTPKRLLDYVEQARAVAYAVEKRQKAQGDPEKVSANKAKPEPLLNLQGIAPAITLYRVQRYSTEAVERECPDFRPGITLPWLYEEAIQGKLKARTAYEAAKFEAWLYGVCGSSLKSAALKDLPFRLIWRNRWEMISNYQGFLENFEPILTKLEAAQHKAHNEGRAELLAKWKAEGKQPFEFYRSRELAEFSEKCPDPITWEEAEKRFLEMANQVLIAEVASAEIYGATGQPFSIWLAENFTAEDDFEEFLENYPTRPSDPSNEKLALKAYLDLRANGVEHETLLAKAGAYWESVATDLRFAKKAENWLAEQLQPQLETASAR